ncbi:MAG: hypothetical protein IPI23_21525 [Bacteroidetes bacterium]|nr:hypothetical protein [Bacteroidota bacterium]
MKSYIKIIVIVCCLFSTAFAQEIKPFKVSIDFALEESGDAKVSYSTKMNASQWDMFKKTTGTNQSLLKRELERALPGYFLSDFEYQGRCYEP